MLHPPERITTFARDVLELAVAIPCPWAVLELTDETTELIRALRVLERDTYDPVRTIDQSQIPIAARLAASHVRASASLQVAVLDQDAALLTPQDAQDVIAYALFRTILPSQRQ